MQSKKKIKRAFLKTGPIWYTLIFAERDEWFQRSIVGEDRLLRDIHRFSGRNEVRKSVLNRNTFFRFLEDNMLNLLYKVPYSLQSEYTKSLFTRKLDEIRDSREAGGARTHNILFHRQALCH